MEEMNLIDTKRNGIMKNVERLIQSGDIDEAEELLNRLINIWGTDYEIENNLGIIYFSKCEIIKSKEKFCNSIRLNNIFLDAQLNLLEILKYIPQTTDNLEMIEEILDLDLENHILQDVKLIYQDYVNQFKTNESNLLIYDTLQMSYDYNYLHIIYDSVYSYSFVEFINKNFNKDEHTFLLLKNNQYAISQDFFEINNNIVIFDNEDLLGYYLMRARVIIVHYLHEYFCRSYRKLKPPGQLYWAFWGGDLYNYIEMEQFELKTRGVLESLSISSKCEEVSNNRNYTIRHLSGFLAFDYSEYQLLKSNFVTNAKYIDFVYPNPVDKKTSNQSVYKQSSLLSKTNKIKILVGNSANPSNNHIEILETLSKMDKNHFDIVIPLSYGGSKAYINHIAEFAKLNFPNNSILLFELLPPDNYDHMLKDIDVVIFNHIRQQGVGNIRRLIQLGKPIYLNSKSTLYKFLVDSGIRVFEFNRNTMLGEIEQAIQMDFEKDAERVEDLFKLEKSINAIKSI